MQEISQDVLLEKYAYTGETDVFQIYERVALALAQAEKPEIREEWEQKFLEAMVGGFVPAGRVMSGAGTGMQATLINCFVQPVNDAILGTPDDPGIMDALAQSAETMRRGGGVGYDFSRLRPFRSRVSTTNSCASGPVSYMKVFNQMCETVESAGARRGAQMAVLRCDHPDILDFVHCKDRPGQMTNFNISVAVTDEFIEAVREDLQWALVHEGEPSQELKDKGAVFNSLCDLWVYRTIPARELWDEIMHSTYDHAEPGIFFIDRVNAENNLRYCEEIRTTNPCAEQPLPDYGCCCLGSINLTRFVDDPFTEDAAINYGKLAEVSRIAVRMLDNVLDVTFWPLEQQRDEAMAKRRVGLGFLGLGDALAMMRVPYDSTVARTIASRIARVMRDSAYMASVGLAKEKGEFPLLDRGKYLDSPYLDSPFVKRLPTEIQGAIEKSGIRNSHLLSIAPTGTISLAFADNASNGIEPPFSWVYDRKKRLDGGGSKTYSVEDHAHRLFMLGRENKDLDAPLPSYFRTALDISANDHMQMVAAVQPYVDSAVSKTVNVPEDYPFEDFKSLYMDAYDAGAKGLATYRPNEVTGAVLSTDPTPVAPATPTTTEDKQDLIPDADRRVRLDTVPTPALASLRWQRRPMSIEGNLAWTYLVDHPREGKCAVFVGQEDDGDVKTPFEVWVNGESPPRGLGALAKSLSMDMRSNDRGWLKYKLESLMRLRGDDRFSMHMPPTGEQELVPSLVAGFARLIDYRCYELGTFDDLDTTESFPVMDALISTKEPKAGPDGTMSWTVDVLNPNTHEDFVLGLKELVMPDGSRRPYSVWLSGAYPRVLDGLCRCWSLDMRIIDPAWIGAKLRQILDFHEPLGDFMARVPGSDKQMTYPSTVSYIAALLVHRHRMLGILDEQGYPIATMGVMHVSGDNVVPMARSVGSMEVKTGRACRECGSYAVVKKDGCNFCTACGWIGDCG